MSCTASDILRRIRTDEELMLAVRAGDLAAFEHLVVRHQSSAWNAAYRFLGDAAEAEDLAQEAFLKILDAAPRYQPTAKFRTYLYRVVTRLCLDRLQRYRDQGVARGVVQLAAAPADQILPILDRWARLIPQLS